LVVGGKYRYNENYNIHPKIECLSNFRKLYLTSKLFNHFI
jgi:hypothetical protein